VPSIHLNKNVGVVSFARAVLAGILFFSLSPPVQATVQYRFQVWKTEQGLPQNTVEAIHQTRDGYLWIGTRFGLARFDGVRFVTFKLANTPEMVNDTCRALAEDKDGSLWIGTDKGLLRWHNNAFRRYSTEDGLCHPSIRSLHGSQSGGVWVGTAQGYSRFINGRFTNYNHLHGSIKQRTAVFEDREGAAWLSVAGGLVRMDPTSSEWQLLASSNHQAGLRILDSYHAANGKLWLGNHRGLHCWEKGKFDSFRPRDPKQLVEPLPTSVSVVFESQTGDFWVALGARRILHQFRDGNFIPFDWPNGEPIEQVNCISQDREGNLWIGTRHDGVLRLQARRMEVFTTRNGLANDHIWSVCQAPDGSIWAGAADGHFCQIKDDRISSFNIPGSFGSPIKAIWGDRMGNLWLGKDSPTNNADSLYLFRDGVWTNYSAHSGISSRAVRAVYEDRAGTLWFGTEDGIHCCQDGRFTRYTTADGLSMNDVRVFLEDRSGTLWIGTQGGGLNYFRAGKFGALTMKDGLSNDFVWALHEDADGTLWVGTEHGLNRYRNGQFFIFTRREGLFDDLINQVLEDDAGNFWISCNGGIHRLSRRELNDVAEGRTNRAHHVAYGESDGMESSETNGENQPAGWKSRDGRLWFPTTKGLVAIDPRIVQDNGLPPPVVIEQVIADEEIIYGDRTLPESKDPSSKLQVSGVTSNWKLETRNSKLHLPAGRARVLQIQYTANSLVDPSKVYFKYRLDGHDSSWHDAGTRRVAFYTNLRAGNYTFRVKACNNHGCWNETGATFGFSLAPHFYQTWPFFGLCAGVVLLSGYGVHRLRVRVLARIQRLEQRHAIELERARIARDVHDDIGGSLTHISLMCELASRNAHNPEEIKNHMQKISSSASDLFRGLDEIIWAINPRHDTLESLLSFICKSVQDFFRTAGIRCRLDIPETLPNVTLSAEVRHNLFLSVKEAAHNIVKHAGATEVRLHANIDGPLLEILIEDNGAGLNESSPALCSGDGLENMRHRLESIGGRFAVESPTNQGTRLRMRIDVSGRGPG